VAFRVSLAAAALWAYILIRRLPVPRGARWIGACLFLGFFNNIVPFCLIVWGQTHIPSGLAGILNASNVIFSVGLAALIFRDERLTARKSIGVILGLVGVALTIGPGMLTHLDLTSLGQLAILGASLSYAVSAIFSRHMLRGVRPEVVAAGMLTVSSLAMVPLAILLEGAPTLHYLPQTWAGLRLYPFLPHPFDGRGWQCQPCHADDCPRRRGSWGAGLWRSTALACLSGPWVAGCWNAGDRRTRPAAIFRVKTA
jgi:drug/metabolite transporter (DMT)-like permease